MSTQNKPAPISLTSANAEALKERLAGCNLNDSDKQIIVGLVSFSFWMQHQLEAAKLSIRRLKRLFGVSTEKKTVKKATT